jgi:hypothetical protein
MPLSPSPAEQSPHGEQEQRAMASLRGGSRRTITEKALMQALQKGHVLVQTADDRTETISIERKRVSPAQFRRLMEQKIIRCVAFWEKGNPRGKTSWYEMTERGRSM